MLRSWWVGLSALMLMVGPAWGAADLKAQKLGQQLQMGAAPMIVDVRTPGEYAEGHVPGAVNMPLQTLSEHLDQIPQDEPVVVYCRSGRRAGIAIDYLEQQGYDQLLHLDGDMQGWRNTGLPVQKP